MENDHLALPKGFTVREDDWLLKERKILDVFYQRARQIGCTLIRTPPLGFSSTFRRAANTTGEKVFEFQDRKGRNLMLAPDSTAAVLRWFLSREDKNVALSERVLFVCPIFRYRHKPNRVFHHVGFSLINESDNKNGTLDEGSLQIGRAMMRAMLDLGVVPQVEVRNLAIIRHCLTRLGAPADDVSGLMHNLRTLSHEDRCALIRARFSDGLMIDEFCRLINLRFKLTEEFPYSPFSKLVEINEMIGSTVRFASLLNDGLAEVSSSTVTFDDFHASEIQGGIAYRFFSQDGENIGDGGSYDLYGGRYDPRISSLKSVCSSIEKLIKKMSSQSMAEQRLLLLGLDATEAFLQNVAEAFMSAGLVVFQRRANGALKKIISQANGHYEWIALAGITEEEHQTLQIRHMESRKSFTISLTDINPGMLTDLLRTKK